MNRRQHEDALRARWELEGQIPLAGTAAGATWHRARSAGSGEPVALLLVAGDAALETADAARRAYLVENPRLLPVVDVETFGEEAAVAADGAPGAHDDPLTVVVYPFPSAPPLAALLAKGTLHPETARSIIGEAATGLEAARRRGLRHLHLDSNRIFVDTADGAVTLLGAGVETAAHAGADPSGREASQRDVVALVTLLHRAISGRSSRPGPGGTVPPPSSVGGVEVPEDLDALCVRVLNGDEGSPPTVKELVAELGPWQSIPVTLEAYGPQGSPRAAAASEPTTARTGPTTAVPTAAASAVEPAAPGSVAVSGPRTDAEAGTETEPREAARAVDADDPSATAVLAPVTDAPRAEPATEARDTSPASDAPSDATTTPIPGDGTAAISEPELETEPQPGAAAHPEPRSQPESEPEPEPEPEEDPDPEPEEDPASQEARALVEELHLTRAREQAAFPAPLSFTPAPSRLPAPVEPGAPATDAPDTDDPDAADGIPATAAVAGVGGAAAHDPGTGSTAVLPSRDAAASETPSVGTPSTAHDVEDEDRGAPSRAGSVAVLGATGAATADGPIIVPGRSEPVVPADTEDDPRDRASYLRDVVGVAMDHDSPRSFELGPVEPEARSRQVQWILLGALLLVILAVVLALTTITSGLRGQASSPLGAPASTFAAPSAPAEGSPAASAPPPQEQAPAAAGPPAIAGASIRSEKGSDHAEDAGRLTDGDPGSVWRSQTYRSEAFGGLKPGLGISVDLAAPSTVTAVVVTTADAQGGSIELRGVNSDGSMGDTLASAPFAGDGEVRLQPGAPYETQSVMLWIPQLPQDSRGHRASIAEIRVE